MPTTRNALASTELLRTIAGPLIIPAPVTAEVDCALIVIANRYGTNRIISFDERHFRAVTPLGGGAFTILPYDA